MSEPLTTTVLLARFEDLVARGLEALVRDDPALELLATDVRPEALDRRLGALRPRVALLDFTTLRRPAEVQHLHVAHPETQLVVLADRPSRAEAAQAIAFGAATLLGKDTQARDVLNAIHLAGRGQRLAPHQTVGPRPGTGPQPLTPREVDVLEFLREGASTAEVASALAVGVETVRTHKRNIYRKLGVRGRRELTAQPVGRR